MCRRQRKIHHTAAMITVDNNTLSSDLRQIAFLDNLSASWPPAFCISIWFWSVCKLKPLFLVLWLKYRFCDIRAIQQFCNSSKIQSFT